MDGASLRARLNRAPIVLLLSPYHLLMTVLHFMTTNVAPASLAMARADSVLPVPGGPYSSTPVGMGAILSKSAYVCASFIGMQMFSWEAQWKKWSGGGSEWGGSRSATVERGYE